jgi:NAD(P)H-flavin reductase
LYIPSAGKITEIKDQTATEKFFRVEFLDGHHLGHEPGQFVGITVLGVGEAPISVSSSPTQKAGFELVVRKTGSVTGALHDLTKGATVGIRGPFGSNFPVEEAKGKDVLVVAGGIGLVPARSFINYILDNRSDYGRLIVLFGARSPAERLFTDELTQWDKRDDVEFLETVDNGDENWKGNVGVITTLFPKIDIDADKTICTIVGPPIMYRFAIIEAKKKGLADDNIIISLERMMKCGVGKCGHCAIGNLYCCTDGPVFKLSEINNISEAI